MPRNRAAVPRILALLAQERAAIAAGTLLLAVGAGLSLAYPQGIRAIVDGAIAGRDPGRLLRIAVLLAGLAALQGVAIAGRHYLFSLAGERGVRRLRERLYASLVAQEIGFFDATRTGELVSRLGTDCATLQGLLSVQFSMTLRHLITAVGALILLLITSPRLTLVTLLVVPPVAIGAVWYGRRVRALARRYQDALADASHVAEESLSAIRTVRAFVAEEAERARYGRAVGEAYEAARRRAVAGSAFMGSASAGGYAAMAAVLGYGGTLVGNGSLSPGALTAFLVYTLLIAMSLGALAELWAEAMRALGAADRVFALTDRTPAMPLAGGTVADWPTSATSAFGKLAPRGARIVLDGVQFAYPTRPNVVVLDGIDLEIGAGEVVALVGASGAGKSTVAALVSRMYDPTAGRVLFDGHDVRSLDPTWLRGQIGVVAQDPVLFSASINENVRYGRPGASHDEVVAACRAAHVDSFASTLPDGYETKVGERGQQLSGGQRQRITIARAVLKDPRVLLLDEATSALDAESEALVQDALERLMIGRTAIIIAHRLSTVARADRVIVLEEGRVVESGAHTSLMQRAGAYRRLVERQLLAR